MRSSAAVELIQFVVLRSQIRPRNSNTKSVQSFEAEIQDSKKFNGIDIFLSPLPNQSQKFKYKSVQASFEAENPRLKKFNRNV
jgi:hypothetical protein